MDRTVTILVDKTVTFIYNQPPQEIHPLKNKYFVLYFVYILFSRRICGGGIDRTMVLAG